MKKMLKLFILLAFIISSFLFSKEIYAKENINVYLFGGATCPHCKAELKLLNELKSDYPINVKYYEVYYNKSNQKLMSRFEKAYSASFNGVPVLVIGPEYLVGENTEKVKELVIKYSEKETYKDPYAIVEDYEELNKKEEGDNTDNGKYKRKVFGIELDLQKVGPIIMGMFLGFADGINPCMFSVLIFLLTYLLSISSKKKMLISGILFAITVFITYFLLMLGVFKIMSLIPYISMLKNIMGIIAIIMGAIMIKDFFFYGKWFSLQIPKSARPMIEKITQKGTYLSAILLAIFSSFVELPCTIGIPMAYITAIKDSNLSVIPHLLFYNFFFIVPLSLIIFSVFKASNAIEKVNKSEEKRDKYKKYMRLIAGVILVLMGMGFIFKVL